MAGYTVLEAPDAATALRIVAEAPEPMDAVVLDLRLPDSSDLSLLAAIRRNTPSSAVVMMTAHGTPEDAAGARASVTAAPSVPRNWPRVSGPRSARSRSTRAARSS